MKNSIKKAMLIAICAVLVFSAVAPSFALSDSDVYSYIDYGMGVRITCNSSVGSSGGTGTITLSFVTNVPHFPQEDYSTRAKVRLVYYSTYPRISDTTDIVSMSATATREKLNGYSIKTAEYYYWANSTPVYDVSFE